MYIGHELHYYINVDILRSLSVLQIDSSLKVFLELTRPEITTRLNFTRQHRALVSYKLQNISHPFKLQMHPLNNHSYNCIVVLILIEK